MKNSPTHDIFTIIETKNKEAKNYWLKVGTGFTNRDGSFNLVFDALPTTGRVQIRLRKDTEESK